MNAFVPVAHGQPLPLHQVQELDLAAFQAGILEGVRQGQRLACLCADASRVLTAVLADDAAGTLRVGRARFAGDRFPSLTPQCPQAHLFEREIAEQAGLVAAGHPWPKPVRRYDTPGVLDFYRVEGAEIHEVAVGPVHAGVIEPGHFRFQCHGEEVFHLEIALGYQHRGLEEALRGGPHKLSLKMAETAAGDTTLGHGWAYCRILEALGGARVPERADLIRAIALELERVANHVGDLGALSGDVGFLPTASFCGAIRGDWLNLTAELCGSRLGRDLLVPGGVRFDLDPAAARALLARVERAWEATRDAVELMWDSASVMVRFEVAGFITPAQAWEIGLVGVAARACGIRQDVRACFPTGPYVDRPIQPAMAESGNVHARAWVRWLEIQESVAFLKETLARLAAMPREALVQAPGPLAPDSLCIALVEGWRGEILHLAQTDAQGRFAGYKIVDPSFHNWFGLALCMRGQQISDFPLCNKSFNLSYCGHDL
jgi:Ni,Fe-hydrogenase III large subunit